MIDLFCYPDINYVLNKIVISNELDWHYDSCSQMQEWHISCFHGNMGIGPHHCRIAYYFSEEPYHDIEVVSTDIVFWRCTFWTRGLSQSPQLLQIQLAHSHYQ